MDKNHEEPSVWKALSESAANMLHSTSLQERIEYQKLLEKKMQEMEREFETKEKLHEMRYAQWRKRIQDLEEQLQYLQTENQRLNDEKRKLKSEYHLQPITSQGDQGDAGAELEPVAELSRDHVKRYSRQLLLKDGYGVEGQKKLLSSSVLVIGAGGIGSTALLYLAASGIGKISVVDFDDVEISNLHRQIIHRESTVGMPKAFSACLALRDVNSSIRYVPVREVLTHENALELVSRHDCVVDASDNPRTRYLINDACVLANKPLISGSAIGTEGQLTVYNHGGEGCYRCLYPNPSPGEGCNSCSDSGVLGTVPGLIGVLQAIEVLKVLTGVGTPMNNRLMMYDSLQCSFFSIKRPPKQSKCPVCGPEATIKSMEDSQKTTEAVQGPANAERANGVTPIKLPEELEISCTEFDRIRRSGEPYILLDVRVKRQFEMCSLDGVTVLNIPLDRLKGEIGRISLRQLAEESDGEKPIYCLCRRGVFSAEATALLAEAAKNNPYIHSVYNIRGGLVSWKYEVDRTFPLY